MCGPPLCAVSRFDPTGWLVFEARSVQVASFKSHGCSSVVDDLVCRLDVSPVFVLFACMQKDSETEGETTDAQGRRVTSSFEASASTTLFLSHWHIVVLMRKTFFINENVSFW